jgi:hypothetical protein
MNTTVLNNGVNHVLSVITSAAGWQSLVWVLKFLKLPHELFNLTHHVVLSSMGSAYLVRAYCLNSEVPDQEKANATLWDVQAYPGDEPNHVAHVYLGFVLTDIVNRKRLKRRFSPVDWFHHVMAATYATLSVAFLPSNALDGPYMAMQEASSIFLLLMEVGVKHASVKAMFVVTFILSRICLGGWVAIQRSRLYMAGLYPSASIMSFWWAQLALNTYFTVLIVRKFCKLFSPRSAP